MTADEFPALSAAFGWDERYACYLSESERGERAVLFAEDEGRIVGYLTVLWVSPYAPFAAEGIPEIKDFNVLAAWRRQGVGTDLMDAAEALVAKRARVVGIGVAMDAGYGAAQALYARRSYVPDARGLTSHNRHVEWGDYVKVDDDLVLYSTKRLVGTVAPGAPE